MAVTHLTTAMASNNGSNFVQASGGITGTNITGTIFSNGLSLSVAAPGGGGGGAALQGSGTYSQNTGTVQFANSNGVTFGLSNNGVMTASVATNYQSTGAYLTTAAMSNHSHGNPTLALTNLSGSTASNSAGLTISLSATPAGGADGVNILAAGTQTANTTGSVVFNNGNGVTFGMSNNSVITASVATNYQAPGAYLTTARASNDAIGLNSALTANGVSMTANSSGLSLNFPAFLTTAQPVGAYLTTAALSNHSHNFATTTTNGAVIVVATSNSLGATIAVPPFLTTAQSVGAYLTTAAQSNHSHGNPTLNLTNLSGTTASNSAGFTLSLSAAAPGAGGGLAIANSQTTYTSGTAHLFVAGGAMTIASTTGQSFNFSVPATSSLVGVNGISISNNGSTISISAISNTINFSAGTTSGNVSALQFSNANGLSFGLNAGTVTASHNGLTTAALSNHSHNFATTTTNGASIIVGTTNSNGVTIGVPNFLTTAQAPGAYLTTAALSNHSHNFATTTTNGAVIVVATTNSAGATIAVPPFLTTAQAPGAYLTTARASNDAIGLNTAQSNVTWTVNSSGISFDARGYAGTGTTFAGTNVTATLAVNSAGVNLSLSAGAGGGVTPVASASNGSFSFTTLAFSNANNVTFGTSAGGIITASVAPPGAGAENNNINLLGANTAGNTTASGSTIGWSAVNLTLSGTNASQVVISAPATSSLSATGNVSIVTNGNTISIGVPVATASLWYPYNEAANVLGAQGNATWQFAPVPTPVDGDGGYVTVDRVLFPVLISNATNSTGSMTVSMSIGLYTKNASSLSLAHSATGSFAITYSGTVNNSTYAGVRLVSIPFSTSIPGGRYYAGIAYRSTTGGANATVNQILMSQMNSNFSGMMGVASNRSVQWPLGLGVLSASSSGIPVSVAFSQIDGTASLAARPPSWHMRNGTV